MVRQFKARRNSAMDEYRQQYPGRSTLNLCVLIFFLKIENQCINLRDLIMTTQWKSCIWFTPKTATLMVAFYYILLSILIVILAATGISVIKPIEVVERKDGNKARESDEILLEGVVPAKVMLCFLICTGFLSLATSIMLVVGVSQEKGQWIYVWMNMHVFILATHFLICFCNMFLELPDQTQKNITIYGSVINGLMTLYFLVVVHNFYIEIDEKIPLGTSENHPYLFFNNKVAGGRPGQRQIHERQFNP
ncbi:hypothetical protein C0J52_12632 [Blattella germanica]|nr:hypothetical protein C0J52_12632 [Blattella germanica]